jgi:phage-related protein
VASGNSGGPSVGALMGELRAGVRSVATVAATAVTQLVGRIRQFTAGFVSAFRPDVVQRFDRAARDLYGTIGEALVPVMERGTRVVRGLGDTLNGVYQAVRPLIDQGFAILDPLMKSLGETVSKLVGVTLDAWLPSQQQMLEVVNQLAPILGDVVSLVAQVAGGFAQFQASVAGALVPVLAAAVPLVKTVATVLAGVVPLLLTPFRVLAATVGPLVRVVFGPLMASMQVLGAVLQPVAAVVRAIGEAFGEVIGEVASLVGDVLNLLVGVLGEMLSVVGELLQPIKDFIGLLASGLVLAIKQVVVWVKQFVGVIRDMLGLPRASGGGGVGGSSVGKGNASVSFTDSTEAWKKVVAATYGMGRGEKEKPAEAAAVKSEGHLKAIAAFIGRIGQPFEAWLRAAVQAGQNVADGASKGGRIASDALAVGSPLFAILREVWRTQELKRS